jgi:serine/threonine-protein kinase
LLQTALGLPADERPRYLASACAGDTDLLTEVESLLAQASQGSGFLSTPADAPARARPGRESLVGRRLGRYTVQKRLGSGGMGEVYLAEDTQLRRPVALKALYDDGVITPEGRQRLLREAQAVAALNHPNIAVIYDLIDVTGDAGTPPHIVMEYVAGETLSDRLRRGPLPVAEALRIGKDVADALAATHKQGIIHRDLKPANLQLAEDGRVKVLDFGLARKIAPATETTRLTTDRALMSTADLRIAGTPGYMSPEQALGRSIGTPTDVFSLGVVLFQMLTGHRPHPGDALLPESLTTITTPTLPVRDCEPEVATAIGELVTRMLAMDPAKRPSAADVVTRIGALLQPDSRNDAAPATGARRRWLPYQVGATVLAVILAAGLTRWWTSHGPDPRRRPSVAIMSLANLSGDPSKGYLATGVAETLTMALSKMPGLIVLSHDEVREVMGTGRDVLKLARDLDVSFVVDGSVQQSGERLRITLRVIRPDGTVAWSDAYEDDAANVFALHRTMAEDIVRQLQGGAARTTDLTVPSTSSVDALTAYWQGRALLDGAASDADFRATAASFRKAIAIDPSYALGYAGLADTLWQQYQVTHDAALPRQALEAGLTALRLDASQPATRVAVATVYQGQGQYDAAADQLRRALELQPSNDDAHRTLGRVLFAQGNPEEAIKELQQAIEYRPRRWMNYNALGELYYRMRRLPDAAATLQRALEMAPNDARTLASLGAVYADMEEYTRAIEVLDRSIRITPTGLALTNLATAYYRLGRFSDAVSAYERALSLDAKSALLHGNLGDAYLRVNRKPDAVREFTAARDLALAALKVNDKDTRAMSRVAVFEAKLGMKNDAAAHAAQAVALARRDPEVQYKQAVVAALNGDRAAALRALEAALTLGYKADLARSDYDLAGIKDSPEFTALVNKHR